MNSIYFSKPKQILNIGGPYVGNLYFNGKLLHNNVIMDNYLINNKKIFFIIFTNNLKNTNRMFSIFYFDIKNHKLFKIDKNFSTIFIERFLDENILEYYKAFHNKIKRFKSNININDYNHIEISNDID